MGLVIHAVKLDFVIKERKPIFFWD